MNFEDQKKYSQHGVDLLSLEENDLISKNFDDIVSHDVKVDKGLFASLDYQTANRLRDLGSLERKPPYILDFKNLLKNTEFSSVMRDMLAVLSKVYDYPVDIEFTANFSKDNKFKVNLLQCRPFQTRGLGRPIKMPKPADAEDCFFSVKGNFMGGNVRLPVEYVIYVNAQAYKEHNEQAKYAVARQMGLLNKELKGKNVMLMGPGRWGTTTPSLGVPVNFSELCNMSVICEVASNEAGFMPELSYGSHFFQDIVETGIFYVAIFDGQKDVIFHPERILDRENMLTSVLPQSSQFSDVIHIVITDGMEVFSDILTQTLLCR